jgi:hypothetical protein
MIEQAAGCRHGHVRAFTQRRDLPFDGLAPEERYDLDPRPGQMPKHLGDLDRQFARGRQDERLDAPGAAVEPLDDRNRKGRGLA